MTNEEIIKGCINNERNAQKALFEKYYGDLMGMALARCKDKSDAKDLVQDTFIKAYNKIYTLKSHNVEPWLKQILKNLFIDNHRRKQVLKELPSKFTQAEYNKSILNSENYIINNSQEEWLQEPENFDFYQSVLETYEAKEIIELVQQLSPKYRAVFTLYVLDDMSHKEIANELGISEGTSKSNYSKARENLMMMIKEREKELVKI